MKTPVSPRTVPFLLLATMAQLSAQNLDAPQKQDVRPLTASDLEGNDQRHFNGSNEATDSPRATSHLPGEKPVYVPQDSSTLGENRSTPRDIDSVVNLDILRNPVSNPGGISSGLALISAIYRTPAQPAQDGDCPTVALSIEQQIRLDPAKALEAVQAEIGANPDCACEIVKAAIHALDADEALVANIVEVAIISAPESMRMISQCAIAASPESLVSVQAVLAKLDPNSGDSSYSSKGDAKSAKSAKDSKAGAVKPPDLPDILDLPPPFPPYIPPIVYPPPVTDVD